jgi:hypothetical protein
MCPRVGRRRPAPTEAPATPDPRRLKLPPPRAVLPLTTPNCRWERQMRPSGRRICCWRPPPSPPSLTTGETWMSAPATALGGRGTSSATASYARPLPLPFLCASFSPSTSFPVAPSSRGPLWPTTWRQGRSGGGRGRGRGLLSSVRPLPALRLEQGRGSLLPAAAGLHGASKPGAASPVWLLRSSPSSREPTVAEGCGWGWV